MNKFKKTALIGTLTVALIASSASSVFAQPQRPDRERPRGNIMQCLRVESRTTIAANVLGITEEDLQARLEAGQTIRDIAAELEIELADVDIAAIREELRTARQQELADILGVTVEELEAAWLDGTGLRQIIEDQGMTLREVVEAFDAECLENVERPITERLEMMAEALGMTVEELQAALDEGQTIREIAEAQGVDLQDLNLRGPRDRFQGFREGRGNRPFGGDRPERPQRPGNNG